MKHESSLSLYFSVKWLVDTLSFLKNNVHLQLTTLPPLSIFVRIAANALPPSLPFMNDPLAKRGIGEWNGNSYSPIS